MSIQYAESSSVRTTGGVKGVGDEIFAPLIGEERHKTTKNIILLIFPPSI